MNSDAHGLPMEQGIAIIGMSGRFPGAAGVDEFWQALVAGREGLTRFSDEELAKAGVPETVRADADYVPVAGALADPASFDAEFFGFTRAEAELTDPQQRLLLECAWEALEAAGYVPGRHRGRVGVFASAANSGYRWERLAARPDRDDNPLQVNVGNDIDMAALRVSYKLDLGGPSVTVQTACSSSLVAVHLAAQSLLLRESDLALAGGTAVRFLDPMGYRYEEGGILSRDGHCRPFDAAAGGTVSGDGVGLVVLKRLDDALADGDHIHAVIRGSAINNDGSGKAGFTAPSPVGQAAVIAEALSVAGVDPGTVQYVEAHGTATPLGDPIEVRALTEAFGPDVPGGSCYLGSVKSNVGHLDVAAGVTGLIKAALALDRRSIPPTLHFREANSHLDLAGTPFRVNTESVPWPGAGHPPRAAVSSFGIGGTNAHVVLEAAPARVPVDVPARDWHIVPLSAREPEALHAAASALAEHLARTDVALADVAHTLALGRSEFACRRAVVCRDRDEAVRLLSPADGRVPRHGQHAEPPSVVFMFPGQGSQYPGMGAGLYRSEPVFREALDGCAELLLPQLGWDVREVAFDESDTAQDRLRHTRYTQPTVFSLDYALARLVMSWGVTPTAMVGHSLGEIVAAVLAGVFALSDAARFVAQRARLMDELSAGRMLSVPLEESVLGNLLGPDEASIAAVNAPHACVVAGTPEQMDAVRERLARHGHLVRELETSHAFHTPLVEPALPALLDVLRSMTLHRPRMPFVSNVSGTWITPEQATDPGYWVSHLRRPVRFADAITVLLDQGRTVFAEIGPGEALSSLVRIRREPGGERPPVVTMMRRRRGEPVDETRGVLEGMAQLWQDGVAVRWAALSRDERRRLVPLPTYRFQRRRHLVARPAPRPEGTVRRERGRWSYLPVWHRSPLRAGVTPPEPTHWLVFADAFGLTERPVAALRASGHSVTTVGRGTAFRRVAEDAYEVRPGSTDDLGRLVRELTADGRSPRRVVHAWSVAGDAAPGYQLAQDLGFFTLLGLAQALGDAAGTRIDVLTNDLHDVVGEAVRHPERATVLGAGLVLSQELSGLTVRHLDVTLPDDDPARRRLTERLLAEWAASGSDEFVAYRGAGRWRRGFAPFELPDADPPWTADGNYLVTGASGEAGLIFAAHLAASGARLVLVGAGGPQMRHAELDAANPGRITHLTADPADAGQLRAAVETARARLGRISGVVHAVDERGTGLAALKGREQAEALLAARVRSTLLLDGLLADDDLDFFILSSATTGILGGFGQLENASAATFLDAFAHARTAAGRPTFAMDWGQWEWDDWYERQAALPQAREQFAAHRLEQGISARDGMAVAASIVASGMPQVVISAVDFHEVLAAQDNLTPTGFMDALSTGPADGGLPDWDPAAVWPDDEVAREVARVWRDVLGLAQLGTGDDFFDVGGNSLFAIQIVSRLRKVYGDLPMSAIFQAPTVDGVAAAIRAQQAETIGLDEFEALLREVEALSAEEAAMRLRSDRAQ